MLRGAVVVGSVLLGIASVVAAEPNYETEIKPLLTRKCTSCHGPLKQEAGLRLDAAVWILKGNADGFVVRAGEPDQSKLLERVRATETEHRMPPEGEGEPLTAAQIELLTRWIAAGAPAPANEAVLNDPREHWAYQLPIQRPLPEDVPAEWSLTPIDRFLAEAHRSAGLTPAEVADKGTLLRRVTFDLTGLPPTREELAEFLADGAPSSWDRVVNRLLESPAYGERWGRHWMDVWRYSDWDGYGNELRGSQRHIWRWRDWIIESLNGDKGYDQMIVEMLAGDEVAPDDVETLRATGFLARNYYKFNRNNWLDNTVDHTAKAFLGITMECAKCHDHKFDPIAQTDFYALRAVFEPHEIRTDILPGQPNIERDGLSRAFDAQPELPTYLFVRGNEKQPNKEQPLTAGLPGIFQAALTPAPVPLPVTTYYPAVKSHVVEQMQQAAAGEVGEARKNVKLAALGLEIAEESLNKFEKQPADALEAVTPLYLAEDFRQRRDDVWTIRSGDWSFGPEGARQTQVSSQKSELVSQIDLPRDFVAIVKFRLIGGQTYHSVGLSFDDHGPERSDAVYVSAYPASPKIQVLLQRGAAEYPKEAERPFPIERGREYTLEVRVRSRTINAYINGQPALFYQLNHDRSPGKLSLWTFDCAAEFSGLQVKPLTPATDAALNFSGMRHAGDVDQAQKDLQIARQKLDLAQARLQREELAEAALAARIAADRAKYLEAQVSGEELQRLARTALDAERQQRVAAARFTVLEAELKQRESTAKPDSDAAKKAAEAVAAAQKKLVEAEAELTRTDGSYTPLGKESPRTSTGRRLALAQWITERSNPLTARVAVNHVWQRHIGRSIVENMFDFGLRSPRPELADLLDWLAVDFMEHRWSLKHLHRQIVTSRAYRLASSTSAELAAANSVHDRDNRRLWKTPIRRLEAEAVRDSLLAVSGSLDLTRGGPDIDFKEGETVPRRSVYFRHAYEKQMTFLVLFDAASPNECYRRTDSIIPQQALALANSPLVRTQAEKLAVKLRAESMTAADFVQRAFETLLSRSPTHAEAALCQQYLQASAANADANLIHTLFNHNDFVTLR